MKAIALTLVTLAISVNALADDHSKNIANCVKAANQQRTVVDKVFDRVIPNYKAARVGAARHNCEAQELDRMLAPRGSSRGVRKAN